MFFDDRLATVLRQRGDSESGARTQFRQLLDILGNRKFSPETREDQSLIAAAWLRMDALAGQIPPAQRAAMIRERGWRLRSADLTAHLADFEPDVASAALNRAELSAEDWTALIPRLPVRARGFLRNRRDLPVDAEQILERLGVYDRGLPQPDYEPANDVTFEEPLEAIPDREIGSPPLDLPLVAGAQPASESKDPVPKEAIETSGDASEIAALVERIAQFKRDREPAPEGAEFAPQLPLGVEAGVSAAPELRSFGFSADVTGKIDWANGEAGPMVIGHRLFLSRSLSGSTDTPQMERAFMRRQPLVGVPTQLIGAEPIAGEWVVDAQPKFTKTGHFEGYLGRFRRMSDEPTQASATQQEADRIRQLLHELRTPVTAVQGYAEVIQQQLFGPAPHEYRALAASVASDAARILAGFEELDRLAKLETGALDMEAGETDFVQIVSAMIVQLEQVLEPRLAGFEFDQPKNLSGLIALEKEDAEALAWRLLATLAGGCAAGEVIECAIAAEDGLIRLTCALPAQLLAEDDVFAADVKPLGQVNAGLFGAGFSLRLARAEARASGGGLSHEDENLVLTLPLLTPSAALPSQSSSA